MDAFPDIETIELRPETKRRLARMGKSREFKGVFQPGSASWPPLLVGRQRQAKRINALLDELLAPPTATRGIHAASLHGPRGAGKTVLIDMVSRALKNNAKHLSALKLTGDELSAPAAVVSEIHAFIPAEAATTTTKAGSISLLVGRGGFRFPKQNP
ncbi:MAG: hypothetical protein OXU70_06200 [Gammaproteobacteria bacterium]|nr:hypothetical protein [Gammaproteobacteria bacterium]